MSTKTLLTVQNAKTIKGESLGYLTGILYMAPHTTVKGINTCPFASSECKAACLYSAGRGRFSNVQNARIKKTELFRDNKNKFFEILIKDITRIQRKAKKLGLKPAIRLNGTSDIDFENYRCKGKNVFEIFPDVQFYDYTKNFRRLSIKHAPNYNLTFSYSGHNLKQYLQHNKHNYNIAVVFRGMPETWIKKPVISGDNHDLRFLDQRGVIVGLTPKGVAKKLESKFIVR